jgi:hypothetical protein
MSIIKRSGHLESSFEKRGVMTVYGDVRGSKGQIALFAMPERPKRSACKSERRLGSQHSVESLFDPIDPFDPFDSIATILSVAVATTWDAHATVCAAPAAVALHS